MTSSSWGSSASSGGTSRLKTSTPPNSPNQAYIHLSPCTSCLEMSVSHPSCARSKENGYLRMKRLSPAHVCRGMSPSLRSILFSSARCWVRSAMEPFVFIRRGSTILDTSISVKVLLQTSCPPARYGYSLRRYAYVCNPINFEITGRTSNDCARHCHGRMRTSRFVHSVRRFDIAHNFPLEGDIVTSHPHPSN